VKVKVGAQYIPSLAAVFAVCLFLQSSSLLPCRDGIECRASALGAVESGGRLLAEWPGGVLGVEGMTVSQWNI
jgi:hypothetical protein